MHRNSAPDYTAWLRPNSWPYDAPGYVYMMRATEQIGATRDDWKGIGNGAARRVVLEAIREHCAYGRLTAAAMIYDGTFKDLPAHRWNNFDCWKWFPKCTISNFEVMDGIHPLARLSHFPLYLTEASLLKVLRPEVSATVSQPPSNSPVQPSRDQLERLMFEIVQTWRDKDSADEYRVTREDFHALAAMCWSGASSEETRDVFKHHRPEKWAKPGPFARNETDINKIAARYGVPQNFA